MKRDSILLLPCIILYALGIYGWNAFMGASNDLVPRLFVMFAAAWLIGWLISFAVFSWPAMREVSHFTRCLTTLILFWPLMGVGVSVAEEWTIAHRMATWDGPSDMGWNYMYAEMSGMGGAGGFRDLWSHVGGFFMFGVVTALLWLPYLLLAAYIYDRSSRLFTHVEPKPNGV